MFDNLSERLERSFKILKGEGKITEINVAETLKDVRKALLDADTRPSLSVAGGTSIRYGYFPKCAAMTVGWEIQPKARVIISL